MTVYYANYGGPQRGTMRPREKSDHEKQIEAVENIKYAKKQIAYWTRLKKEAEEVYKDVDRVPDASSPRSDEVARSASDDDHSAKSSPDTENPSSKLRTLLEGK